MSRWFHVSHVPKQLIILFLCYLAVHGQKQILKPKAPSNTEIELPINRLEEKIQGRDQSNKINANMAFTKCGENDYKHPFEGEPNFPKTANIKVKRECHPTPFRIISGTVKLFADPKYHYLEKSGCYQIVPCDISGGICEKKPTGDNILTEDVGCIMNDQQKLDKGEIGPRFTTATDDTVPKNYMRYPIGRHYGELESNDGIRSYIGADEAVGLKNKFNGCGRGCKKGVLRFAFHNEQHLHLRLHLTKSCNVVRVCFGINPQTNRCNKASTMTLFTKNGIVIMPYESRGVKLDMNMDPASSGDVRIVDLGWGIKDPVFYVSNAYNEMVVGMAGYSPRLKEDKETAVHVIPDDAACIHDFGVTGNYVTGMQYSDKSDTNIPIGVIQNTTQIYSGTTKVPELYTTQKELQFAETTTAAPVTVPQNAKSMASLGGPSSLMKATGEGGWYTWALFYGFVSGALVTGFVIAIFFYIFRRSIYSEWYRGMFKRYRCDASGTTGGVTGAEFGDTTTGTQTIGATTGGATKTMGNTAGSTMGNTSTLGNTTSGATGDTLAL